MTSNQRLMFAVALSIVFFVAYTAIFPPAEQVDTPNKNKIVSQEQTAKPQVATTEDKKEVSYPSKVDTVKTVSNDIVTVNSKDFILKIDTLGRISSKELLEEKFNNTDGTHAQLIQPNATKPLFIRFSDDKLNSEAMKVPYTASVSSVTLGDAPQTVKLTQKLSSLTVTKELTFYSDGHYDINISLSEDKKYFLYLGDRPKVNTKEQMMSAVGAMVYTGDELLTMIEDGDADSRQVFSNVDVLASFDQYTAIVLYGFKKDENIVIDSGVDDNPVAYFEGTQHMKLHGYIGPKEYSTLKNIEPVLTHVIEYGWFTFAAKPMFKLLSWLYGIFGNWGWAIIALTLVIRAILYPLTYKGMMSMQKIKELSPKLKEIKEKYKGDPQRINSATMELYKKHKANPLGGCLPMLLQIPVFYAIYRLLLNSVELQGAPWMLWVDDLSRMDQYYILPILMGASMLLQQRMTPQNFTDPMQEKIMKYLPVIFTFFFLNFPSGLVLYWFVNNLFSILQQFIVNQQFANQKAAQKVIEKNEAKKSSGNKK